MKEPGKALADLQEAVSDTPTATRLYHLARAHHESKDTSKVRAILREARKKGLEVARLHPVEQDAARELLAEYGMR